MWWEKHVRKPWYGVAMVVATLIFLPTGPIGWLLVALAWWWYLSLLKRGVQAPVTQESACATQDKPEATDADSCHEVQTELSPDDRVVLEQAGINIDDPR